MILRILGSHRRRGIFQIAKQACFDLNMTTAVNCYGSVGSWQKVDQEEVGGGVNCGLFFFSCFLPIVANVASTSRVNTRENIVE